MSDYSHLSTSIAETRYVLAAHYLDVADNVVEVGGHRIGEFLPWHHPRDRNERHIWCIDPSAPEPAHYEKHKVYPMPVTAFNFGMLDDHRGRRGLCLLGLEMFDKEYGDGGTDSLQHLCENVNLFDIAVMDYVPSNRVAHDQAMVLWGALAAFGFKLKLRFGSDWIYDGNYKPNESFGKHREFWVMEKP